jgi:hypothetical protein
MQPPGLRAIFKVTLRMIDVFDLAQAFLQVVGCRKEGLKKGNMQEQVYAH